MSLTSSRASARCSRPLSWIGALGGDFGEGSLDLLGQLLLGQLCQRGRIHLAETQRAQFDDRRARWKAGWRRWFGLTGPGAACTARCLAATEPDRLFAQSPDGLVHLFSGHRCLHPRCADAPAPSGELSIGNAAAAWAASAMMPLWNLLFSAAGVAKACGVLDEFRQVGDRYVDLHLQCVFDLVGASVFRGVSGD